MKCPGTPPLTRSRLGALGALASASILATLFVPPIAAQATTLPTVEPADCGRFEQLGRRLALSPDGAWLAYEIERVDRSRELRVRRAGDPRSERHFEQGTSPEISDDGRWLAWSVTPTDEERKAQGTEFFNVARRAGKQMVLLVYEGENHGFRNEANQRDYHRRILEWFGHYLKGEEAPAWITEGVAYEDLEAEKKRVAAQRATEDGSS